MRQERVQVIEKGAIWGRRRTREVTSYCRVVFLEFICVALVFVACFLALVFVGFVPRVLVFVFRLCVFAVFLREHRSRNMVATAMSVLLHVAEART